MNSSQEQISTYITWLGQFHLLIADHLVEVDGNSQGITLLSFFLNTMMLVMTMIAVAVVMVATSVAIAVKVVSKVILLILSS